MRSVIAAAALIFVTAPAFSAELEVTKVTFDVRIESVKAVGSASNGYVDVVASAMASNACMIPAAANVALHQSQKNGVAAYTLVQISDDRMCPAVFSPTPYTLKVRLPQGATLNGLSVSENGNPKGYVCQTGWVNCMPIVAEGRRKYCTDDYANWAEKNCGGRPQIAQ